jgi:electron transport complex protein RnfG
VIGKNPAKDNLSVSKDGGDIDAITAATISSRAFLEAIRLAYAAYTNNFHADVNSSATPVLK